jgi:hypothetical protein
LQSREWIDNSECRIYARIIYISSIAYAPQPKKKIDITASKDHKVQKDHGNQTKRAQGQAEVASRARAILVMLLRNFTGTSQQPQN